MSQLLGRVIVAVLISWPAAAQHRVDDGDWSALVALVAEAEPHDTIVVGAGTYRGGTLYLTRPLTVLGEPGSVLDGEGSRALVVVEADSVTVAELTLRNTGLSFTEDRAAIRVEDARFCEIRGNVLQDTFFGIYLANAGDCRVHGNVLRASSDRETRAGNGIHLWYSKRIVLEGNQIEGHRDGIYFEFVEDSRVRENDSLRNLRYGLHFMFSDGCQYRRNLFAENGAGVAVMYTSDVVMEGNTFEENRGGAAFGLLLKEIRDSRIAGNRFLFNSVAMRLEGANRVEIHRNEFRANGWAVQVLANSDGSAFTSNNFLGNSFDVSTNSRSTASTFSGNYWDRYGGYDRDRDGVGDVPFRPVRLFSLVVEQNEPALLLQRSLMVSLLDLVEEVLPVLTPGGLIDESPSFRPVRIAGGIR